MLRDTLFVVLPCYNEAQNIRELIKVWERQEKRLNERNISLRILVVNDGSRDNSLHIAQSIAKTRHNITVLDHKVNMGLGEAVNTGIIYAISRRNKGLLCIMDADLTQEPHYIYSMIDKLQNENLDCVIASRYREGSKVEGLSLYRKALSYGARVVYSASLRIPNVRDYTCGYRVYKLEALDTLLKRNKGKIVTERGFACMMELLIKLNKEGFKIGEVPFKLKYHLKGGESKMKVGKTIFRSLAVMQKV